MISFFSDVDYLLTHQNNTQYFRKRRLSSLVIILSALRADLDSRPLSLLLRIKPFQTNLEIIANAFKLMRSKENGKITFKRLLYLMMKKVSN